MNGLRKLTAVSLRTRFVLGVAVMPLPLALLGASAFVSLRSMAAADAAMYAAKQAGRNRVVCYEKDTAVRNG